MRKSFILVLLSIILASCDFVNLSDSKIDLIPVCSGEKWGYINKKGRFLINPQFAQADYFREGLALVKSLDGKMGFIDKKGNYKISAIYKDATPFSEGLAFVVSDGGYPICIDKKGETKFIVKHAKHVYPFHDGLSKFYCVEGKAGFIDKKGNIVIQTQFEDVSNFHEGLAAVKKNNKWGFINKEGKIIIIPQFEYVSSFDNGIAAFYNGKQWGFINKNGNYKIITGALIFNSK